MGELKKKNGKKREEMQPICLAEPENL